MYQFYFYNIVNVIGLLLSVVLLVWVARLVIRKKIRPWYEGTEKAITIQSTLKSI